MTHTLRRLVVLVIRVLLFTVINAIALYFTALLLPHMEFFAVEGGSVWLSAVAAAILLGLVNLLIRPIILLIARPLGFFALFLVGFLVNGIVLLITAYLLPGFELSTFWEAIVAGLLFGIFNTILSGLFELDDDDSYYQRRIEQKAAHEPFPGSKSAGRGLVMLEIDGLSYHHMRKAIDDGLMPRTKQLMEEQGYELALVDCGIPSQTSACQAGIMFGNNDDIPAFRWYDKDQQKLIVSSKNAGELNSRYAQGHGLMRGGSSIDNMLNGDAYKSLITAADMFGGDSEERRRRAHDVYLLALNPLFLTRMLSQYFGMVLIELWQAFKQRIGNVQPRLNRLQHGYPFVRAATSVLMRDLAADFALLDIARGSPSIYVTWPGYDEVAHHSGPWTSDALGELKRYDKVIGRVHRAIRERAPRPYDLIILSDHGQSFGPTFKQRYGLTIKEFIEQQLPAGTTVTAEIGGDTGMVSLNSVSAELANVAEVGVGSSLGQSVARQGKKAVDRALLAEQAREAAAAKPAQVTAFGSGNLAQVYFDLFARKITLTELNAAYPGVVDALLMHEGIGLVCGYLDDGTPVAMGKRGVRNLHTGEVSGDDPLLPYAPAAGHGASTIDKRAWQVRKVMDFPHAGDLMLISTVYPDGTVAALEELIGSHGGIGGEQTDAFIFHPADMEVSETRNSTDVYHILNNHRDKPIELRATAVETMPEPDEWSPVRLLAGLVLVGTWMAHLGRCIIPDRDAFEGVVRDRRMTGPALLIMVVGDLAWTLTSGEGSFNPLQWLMRLGLSFVSIGLVYAVARRLGGSGTFTDTTRAIGFARGPYLLSLLALYPPIAPAVRIVVLVLGFLGVLFGASAAHKLSGWRTVLLPILMTTVVLGGMYAVSVFIAGAELSLNGVLETFGLPPRP